MPVVMRDGPYQFLFFALDRDEPPHVHVKRDRQEAKFWLQPIVRLAKNAGFRPHELNDLERKIELNRDKLLESWNAFFRP
jgi:hypothetical protein